MQSGGITQAHRSSVRCEAIEGVVLTRARMEAMALGQHHRDGHFGWNDPADGTGAVDPVCRWLCVVFPILDIVDGPIFASFARSYAAHYFEEHISKVFCTLDEVAGLEARWESAFERFSGVCCCVHEYLWAWQTTRLPWYSSSHLEVESKAAFSEHPTVVEPLADLCSAKQRGVGVLRIDQHIALFRYNH